MKVTTSHVKLVLTGQEALRTCLAKRGDGSWCNAKFPSKSPGHRVCPDCSKRQGRNLSEPPICRGRGYKLPPFDEPQVEYVIDE